MEVPHLNRVLALETPQNTPDGAGGFEQTWQVLGELWAELRAGTGRVHAVQGMTLGSVPMQINVRWAPEGSPRRPRAGQRLREGGRLFAILAVADGPAGYLRCFATEEVSL
ncbi:head-tail adaptor protein [Rhodobacteraceae bacterium]|nr:head-tail adaptor protein [Paracoccaceae bacterium]